MNTTDETTGVGVVEVTDPLESFDFSRASRWELLVLHEGEPTARLRFPSPGAIDSAELARELIWPHAEARRRSREIADELLRRMDIAPRTPVAPSCSVVLCTHGRPEYLPAALDALAALDPAPLEVIVVDNAPGERDSRDIVEERGFRYLREDRKGLDNARNTGLRAAAGEVVAFTDDDCVVPSGWLRHLGESFEDPLVAAITGPAFPYQLDTPARVRMERQASLTRGMHRRSFDWTLISPLHAGQAGVGANMAIRASLLKSMPEPFPPELDAGTETLSGGDTYLFARLLTAGHRIVYEPRAYVFHLHRAEWSTLEHAVAGYGTGASAAMCKLLVEDGELEAPRAALWLLSQYLRTQRRRVLGRADAVETRIAWAYLRGALRGPGAWRRARRTQLAVDPLMRPAPEFPAPTSGAVRPHPGPAGTVVVQRGEPAVSVVVPTVGRPGILARCLAALEAQTIPANAFEVIVVDDSPGRPAELRPQGKLVLRPHRTGGRGAAVARNAGAEQARGELLLFLDDDLIAAPDLLQRHIAAHSESGPETVVIGYSPPRPPRANLAALGAALWWEDHFRDMERARALTFTEALSGNVSLKRTAFLDGRQFDPNFAQLRREDWEWGFRLLEGGAGLRYEPAAVATHQYELEAGARIRACRLEGRGDALLMDRHPDAAPFLPLALHRAPTWRHPARRLAMNTLGHPGSDPFVLAVLGLMEGARLRSAWAKLYSLTQRAAYAHGLRAGGWRPGPLPRPPVAEVELTGDQPLPRPGAIAPLVRVTHEGHPLAEVDPRNGWRGDLADQVAERLQLGPPADLRERPLRTPVTVVLGPARAPGDERELDRLRAAGARVELADGDEASHWERILEVADRSQTELIALPLPGRRPAPTWLTEVEPAFDGPLVALAIGQGIPASSPHQAITLHERSRGRVPYAPLGGPADYLVLRSAALPELGRAAAYAAYGPMAVAFACAEEVLAGGSLVAHRNTHGLDPSDGAWADQAERERAKLRAWGALLAEHAGGGPRLRGAAWLGGLTAGGLALGVVRRARGESAPVSTMDTGAALVGGYAAAIRRRGSSWTRR